MKQNLVLLVLLFILHLQAAAQINYTEKFKKELAAHPAEDTFRVNRLNELIYHGMKAKIFLQRL